LGRKIISNVLFDFEVVEELASVTNASQLI
jgi:hypothetical protein